MDLIARRHRVSQPWRAQHAPTRSDRAVGVVIDVGLRINRGAADTLP